MNIVLALGLSFLSGYLIVSAAWPRDNANQPERWMKLFISAGFGIGIFSIAYFVDRWLGIVHILATDLCLVTLLLAVYLLARFLFLGGSHWRDGFSTLIPWSHSDYPPLVPAAIAHVWSYIGHDDPIVPAILGLVFTFATLGLLVSSLATLRGIT